MFFRSTAKFSEEKALTILRFLADLMADYDELQRHINDNKFLENLLNVVTKNEPTRQAQLNNTISKATEMLQQIKGENARQILFATPTSSIKDQLTIEHAQSAKDSTPQYLANNIVHNLKLTTRGSNGPYALAFKKFLRANDLDKLFKYDDQNDFDVNVKNFVLVRLNPKIAAFVQIESAKYPTTIGEKIKEALDKLTMTDNNEPAPSRSDDSRSTQTPSA